MVKRYQVTGHVDGLDVGECVPAADFDALEAKLHREQKELVYRQVQASKFAEARDVWKGAALGLMRRLSEACDHAEKHVHDSDPERGCGRFAAVPELTTETIRALFNPPPRESWCSYCGTKVTIKLDCECGRVAIPENIRAEYMAYQALAAD